MVHISPRWGLDLGDPNFYRHSEETPQQKPPLGLRFGLSDFIFLQVVFV